MNRLNRVILCKFKFYNSTIKKIRLDSYSLSIYAIIDDACFARRERLNWFAKKKSLSDS